MKHPESFADQLQRYRKAAGLSQEDLAERAGLTAGAIGALERGHRRHPYPHTVQAIAEALDLTREERAVLAASVPARGGSDRPPAVESRRPPGVLPVPPIALVGREDDLVTLVSLVRRGYRLITLTGPGGVGKTRLALALAGELSSEFGDGAVFVTLAPLAEVSLVIPVIANALGVPQSGEDPVRELLEATLRDRKLLLVIDNFEHVINAAVEVATVTGPASGVVVVATSRAPLRVQGEQEYPVRPLAVPDLSRVPAVEELGGNPAVDLFLMRARAVRPDFVLTRQNAVAVAAICRRLDGLPLAIELAAARIRALEPTALLARLDRALPLLTHGARDLPERQRTMEQAIAWSHDLLGSHHQMVFRRLSVFAGGWTLDAAEAVGAGPGVMPDEVLDLLADLVEQSLVLIEPGETIRYRMLEPVRQFALLRREAAGEAHAVSRAHAMWCLGLADRAAPHMYGMDAPAWLARLDAEHHNIRAALGWTIDNGEPEIGLHLACTLIWTWLTRYPREGRAWLERAIATPTEVAPAVRGKALFSLGTLVFWVDADGQRSFPLIDEALTIYREIGDQRGGAEALSHLAYISCTAGDLVEAEHFIAEGEHLSSLLDAPELRAGFMTTRALIFRRRGEHERARILLEDALSIHRNLGFQWSTGWVLLHLANLARDVGRTTEAFGRYAEAATLFDVTGDGGGAIAALRHAGIIAARFRQFDAAARLFGAADALGEDVVVPMLPLDPAAEDRARKRARDDLGEEAFAAAWEAGRVLSLEEAISFVDALAAGAVHPALPRVPQSPAGLSEREVEVLRLIAEGLTNARVAERLYLSPRTVDAHLRRIYDKLGASSRAEAVRFAVEHRLSTASSDTNRVGSE